MSTTATRKTIKIETKTYPLKTIKDLKWTYTFSLNDLKTGLEKNNLYTQIAKDGELFPNKDYNISCVFDNILSSMTFGASLDDIKPEFELGMRRLLYDLNYDEIGDDGMEHLLAIIPSFDYISCKYDRSGTIGPGVRITFTIIDAVKDMTFKGRITDKTEALEFIEEYSFIEFSPEAYGGYIDQFPFVDRYVERTKVCTYDVYLIESPILACIDERLLAYDKIRNALIRHGDWPLNRKNGSYLPMKLNEYIKGRHDFEKTYDKDKFGIGNN